MALEERLLELFHRLCAGEPLQLPQALLEEIVQECGSAGGRLLQGHRTLAQVGQPGTGAHRWELPGGREGFVLELDCSLPPLVRLAAGTALAAWALREELKAARFSERRRVWEAESLRAIAEALGGTLDEEDIAEALLFHVTALLDARQGEVWLLHPPRQGGEPPSCLRVAQVGEPVLTEREVLGLPATGWLEGLRMAVPIGGRNGRRAVLALGCREVRGGVEPFTEKDFSTLTLFASQAALALDNAFFHAQKLEQARLERELALAAAVQQKLLPSQFELVPGWELAARSIPSWQVGGDFYDLFLTPWGALAAVVDVAGKGMPAALLAASLQGALRAEGQRCESLEELAGRLQQHLLQASAPNQFATAFFLRLRPGCQLQYLSAGHVPGLCLSPSGAVELLSATGPPLGLLEAAKFFSRRLEVVPGSLLLVATDGLTEAADLAGQEFTWEKVVKAAKPLLATSLPQLVEGVLAAVATHAGGAFQDDRTVLAARCLDFP